MRAILFCIFAFCAVSAVTPFMDIWEEIDDAKCTLATYKDICLRVYKSTGAIDGNFAKNIKLLNDAKEKYTLSAYIVPCVTCDIPTQVMEIFAALKGLELKYLWIAVEGTWNSDRAKNRQFLADLVAELKKGGITPGIQTGMFQWHNIMERDTHEFATLNLWYLGFNGRQDDRDFRPFGGWHTPFAKMYHAHAELCGDTINEDIYF